jgi:4a-hydroxytetrahydrobiopterin dehydratase
MTQAPAHDRSKPLSLDQVVSALANRSPWTLLNGAIELRLKGLPFAEICRLVVAVNQLANEMDHHPDVSYGYQHLTIRFQTHDVNGITQLDLACADQILKLLG